MQTCKPISTISYNTESFLKSVLDRLIKEHIIDYYMYIPHIGEFDFEGKKEDDHTHLFVIPNKRINTAELGDFFIEPDPTNDLPLKCMTWNTSKSDDWILYDLHDEKYLLSKMETRQIHYKYEDLRSSDYQDLRRRYRMAYQSSGYARACNLYEYARSGGSLNDLMRIGAVPINQVEQYDYFFKKAKQDILYQDINKETGPSDRT